MSDDITPETRLLLHRDVRQRLETLAPFITWDSAAVPTQTDGGLPYVIPGTTVSTHYPYAEQVSVGDEPAGYARGSVVATVDAFNGDTSLYVTDPAEPLLRAWQSAFPTLSPPSVSFLRVPDRVIALRPARFTFRALDCRTAVARVVGPDGSTRSWRFPCPAARAAVTWTPDEPGRHLITVIARRDELASLASVRLRIGAGDAAQDPESGP